MRLQLSRCFTVLGVCAVMANAPIDARAGIEEQSVSYTFNYFSDVDRVSVFSHYTGTNIKLEGDWRFSLNWVHDVVVIPAIEAAPGSQDAVDAITTASRPLANSGDPFEDFVKVRDAFDFSTSYYGVSVMYYLSTESDYFAQMVSMGYNRDFLRENLNLALGFSYSWDDIEPLADADTQTIPDTRKTVHYNLVATQILTPTTVLRIGGEWNDVLGLQHDPYRNVYVAGANVPEHHPDARKRKDAFVRLSQYLPNRSSVKVDYRYYTDDWGVDSHTIGGKLNQYINESFVMRYRYRYYTQAAAYFHRNEYLNPGGVSGLQTSDYRMGEYGAHLFGTKLNWRTRQMPARLSFLNGTQVSISYERYFNSNNFTANIFETGLVVSF